ncbi:hypothetical protein H0G86_001717 [Trichoderma simmonsii]|uniref:Uncharacterized protein n=1 Tax=Trichoderma simmonsii TaxID=1491479 RepID=A0A8G0PF80_9HYPO|nr:hypothetical protein H0G86_001717 [Trichoderma simmonsii]
MFRAVRTTERPRIGTQQAVFFCKRCLPSGPPKGSDSSVQRARACRSGLNLNKHRHEKVMDEASMRPDQHFSQDAAPAPIPTSACSADRVSGPYPRRTFAGAITNASAQAPGEKAWRLTGFAP